MTTFYFWVVLAYLLALVGVGLRTSRAVSSQEDFSVAVACCPEKLDEIREGLESLALAIVQDAKRRRSDLEKALRAARALQAQKETATSAAIVEEALKRIEAEDE